MNALYVGLDDTQAQWVQPKEVTEDETRQEVDHAVGGNNNVPSGLSAHSFEELSANVLGVQCSFFGRRAGVMTPAKGSFRAFLSSSTRNGTCSKALIFQRFSIILVLWTRIVFFFRQSGTLTN
jgi:hypothetical protein